MTHGDEGTSGQRRPGDAGRSNRRDTGTVRVAMVCLGNICRSPMAAAVAQEMVERAGLADRVEVESFGTAGYHVGSPADERARDALRRRGWPPDGHSARRITADDISHCDLVLVADRSNLTDVLRLAANDDDRAKVRLLRSFDAESDGDDEVPDPWFGGPAGFDQVLDLIEAACSGLVEHLAVTAR